MTNASVESIGPLLVRIVFTSQWPEVWWLGKFRILERYPVGWQNQPESVCFTSGVSPGDWGVCLVEDCGNLGAGVRPIPALSQPSLSHGESQEKTTAMRWDGWTILRLGLPENARNVAAG